MVFFKENAWKGTKRSVYDLKFVRKSKKMVTYLEGKTKD